MAVLISDNFDRTNGALGSGWGLLTAFNNTAPTIVSNQVQLTNVDTSWNNAISTTTVPDDHYLQLKIIATGASSTRYVTLISRLASPSVGTFYWLRIFGPIGASTAFQLNKYIAMSNTTIVSTTTVALATGDVVRFEASGTTQKIFKNGGQVLGTQSDTGIPTGTYVGFSLAAAPGDAMTAVQVDDFEAGDFGVHAIVQDGGRWRSDLGSETDAAWLADQDTAISRAVATNTRLRFTIDASDIDPASIAYQLEWNRPALDAVWRAVPTTAPAMPAWQATGTADSGTTTISPGWPTHLTGDVALLFCQSENQAISLSTAAGFAEIPGIQQGTGTAGDAASTRIAVFWCRATSASMTAPTVADSGGHTFGVIVTFRGCIASGDPWNVVDGGVKATATTTCTHTAVTTTIPNCLIVNAAARNLDSAAAAFSAWANSSLSSLTSRYDLGTTAGDGGGINVVVGGLAQRGSSGVTTATVTSSLDAHATIALRPESSAILMSLSSNIADSAATATTAQMISPYGKTTADFQAGKISDDTNPMPAIDITTNKYIELEWCVVAPAIACLVGDYYEFRVTAAGTELDSYLVTPQWTIASPPAAGSLFRISNLDGLGSGGPFFDNPLG